MVTEFRCAKDDYRADTIAVHNRAGNRISFKVGKWLSRCGRPGQNYSDQEYHLGSGENINIDFSEVGSGSCNELFIYQCRIDNRDANCLDTVTATPNL
uniref:Uncharacterized protein LOC114330852 isoform X2 n=1 Tax=Diabrotica virgifera virgifera TaxID=50390 RepID=A0A6P7FJ09_DIAVI